MQFDQTDDSSFIPEIQLSVGTSIALTAGCLCTESSS